MTFAGFVENEHTGVNIVASPKIPCRYANMFVFIDSENNQFVKK